MQAFIAVLLVAAVSGQMTTGVDRNVFDFLLRTRQMYPTQYQQQMDLQKLITGLKYPVTTVNTEGVYGDLVVPTTNQLKVNEFLPFTQQQQQVAESVTLLIPADLTLYKFTLRQLFTLPIFQQYYTLPLFQKYINTVEFQVYLTSGNFQQYMTLPQFQQFFVEPVLFYKYIFPVVQTYQKYVQIFNQQQQVTPITTTTVDDVIKGQDIDMYNVNFVKPTGSIFTPTTIADLIKKQTFVPTMYNNINNVELYKYLNKMNLYNNNAELFKYLNINNNMLTQQRLYNNIDNVLVNKFQVPQIYEQTLFNKYQVPQIYEQTLLNKYNMINKINNNMDMLNINKYNNLDMFNINKYNTMIPTGVKTTTTADLYLEKIVKDLVEGKIDIQDLKTKNVFVDEKLNKIVDPITGEVKIVDEKIVKPVIVDGEMTKEELINKAILLNKNIFKINKL